MGNEEGVHEKITEEIAELKEAERTGTKESIEEEIGDLLFTIANLSRFHDIDPEAALRLTITKFVRRFAYVESKADLENPNPKVMDELWNEIKDAEKRGKLSPVLFDFFYVRRLRPFWSAGDLNLDLFPGL